MTSYSCLATPIAYKDDEISRLSRLVLDAGQTDDRRDDRCIRLLHLRCASLKSKLCSSFITEQMGRARNQRQAPLRTVRVLNLDHYCLRHRRTYGVRTWFGQLVSCNAVISAGGVRYGSARVRRVSLSDCRALGVAHYLLPSVPARWTGVAR